jgi:hypothetical protein
MGMTGAGWRCRAAVVAPGMRSVKCLWCNTMQNVPESQRAYECWLCATPTAATVQLQDSAQEFLNTGTGPITCNAATPNRPRAP